MAGLDEFQLLLRELAIEQATSNSSRFSRQQVDPFELPENKFVKLFRVNKKIADEVINCLEPHMRNISRSSALTAQEKLSPVIFKYFRNSQQRLL